MCVVILLILAILVLLFFLSPREDFGVNDKIEDAMKKLKDEAVEISDDILDTLKDDVVAVYDRMECDRREYDKARELGTSEDFSFFHPINHRYWPQYYYSFPYNYETQGAWPPGMYSKLYHWEPGYSSGSGWSLYMRPGVTYKAWQRSRWVKNNGKYYFINNGGLCDRENDFYRMH